MPFTSYFLVSNPHATPLDVRFTFYDEYGRGLQLPVTVPGQRRFTLNHDHYSKRLTICETLREIVRETRKPCPDVAKIEELARAGFDFGKRMDRRLKELKGMLDCSA